jgi:hypothetical protein
MIRAAVCLEEAGEVDCYEVPGANAILGERVRFLAEEVPVNPTDRSKGMHRCWSISNRLKRPGEPIVRDLPRTAKSPYQPMCVE